MLTLSIFMVLGWGQAAFSEEYGLGDIPLDPETYQKYLKVYPDAMAEGLPAAYDARNDGIVTSAKNQGACGSCWAFASAGALESHILKDGGQEYDISEQQQVSCNLDNYGCCGGYSDAVTFWESQGPILESCGSYEESGTSCSTAERTVPCSNLSGCSELSYRVTDWHTVSATVTDFKTSLYNDGPSYWRYDVFEDFMDFWRTAQSGEVYVNINASEENYLGGHAVLIIGWDDAKGAYLCKNSWGATGGPNEDGTFWIAYSGHADPLGLRFGMANFELTGGSSCPECPPDGDINNVNFPAGLTCTCTYNSVAITIGANVVIGENAVVTFGSDVGITVGADMDIGANAVVTFSSDEVTIQPGFQFDASNGATLNVGQ